MTEGSPEPEVTVGDLVDEYVQRLRCGENPSIEEFIQRYPDLVEEIQDVFPAIKAVESCKSPVVDTALANNDLPLGIGPGAMVGEYRLLRQIGRGGMGLVYEAEQPSLGRRVAIKILPPTFAKSADRLARFQREVRAAAKLHHTNIVPVFGVGESDGLHYYTMQHINGEGLDHVLRQIQQLRLVEGEVVRRRDLTHTWRTQATRSPSTPLQHDSSTSEEATASGTNASRGIEEQRVPTQKGDEDAIPGNRESTNGAHSNELSDRSGLSYYRSIARLGWQIADALTYAHGQGILHRDIKPSNLLLDLQGTVWLTDFGLAKELESENLTSSGEFVGTLRFMAPERLRGRSLPEGDIYSLGLTLYELLTLQPVWDERDPGQLVTRIIHELPTNPRRLDHHIPRDFETIILKCIAKSPNDRYRKAADLAEDLQRFLSDRPILARRFGWSEQSWRWCRRNPLAATLVATIAGLLLAIAILNSWTARLYRSKHLEAVRHLSRAERAETDLRDNNAALQKTLAESLEAQAHALRISGEQGCHLHALELLDRAAAINRSTTLRDEVVAALVKFDARPSGTKRTQTDLVIRPAYFEVNESLSQLVILDQKLQLRVMSIPGGRELLRSDYFCRKTQGGRADGASLSLLRDSSTVLVGCPVGETNHGIWKWSLSDPSSSPTSIIEGPIRLPPAVSLDERRVAIPSTEGGIRIFDFKTGVEQRRIAESLQASELAFHPDGTRLAFGINNQRRLLVWDLASDEATCEFSLPDTIRSLAWNQNGRLLAAGCQDGLAYVFDIQSKRQLSVTKGVRVSVDHVRFLQPGDWLCAWCANGPTIIAEPTLGEILQVIPGGLVGIRHDGAACLIDDEIQATEWQIAIPVGRRWARHLFSLNTVPGAWMEGPRSLDVSPDGRLLATADLDGLRIFSLDGNIPELAWIRTSAPDWVKFDAESQNLFANSTRKGVRRWPLTYDQRDQGIHLQVGEPVNFGPVTSDRPAAILASQRQRVFLGWHAKPSNSPAMSDVLDLKSGKSVGFQQSDDRFWPVAISPGGDTVITSTSLDGGATHAWDLAKNEIVHTWPYFSYGTYSPDGKEIVLRRSGDRTVQIIRVDTWQLERTITCRDTLYAAFSVSPDSQFLAISDRRGIRLFHFPTATYLMELPTDRVGLEVIRPEFSPDGSLLATGRMGHVVHIWDLRALRAELKKRNLDWNFPDFPAPRRQMPIVSATVVLPGSATRDPAPDATTHTEN